jgi:hypothetical protein
MTEALAIFSAVVAVVALFFAAKSAAASEKSAGAAEESVTVAKRSADAADKSNLLANEGLELQRASVRANEDERQRRQRTRLVVDGWSGKGGLVVTNQGPGPATDILVVLTSPRRHATFAGLRPEHQERFPIRETNGWPEGFEPGDPPGRGQNPDVAFVRWRNADGSVDETGWVQAPNVP